MRLFVALEIPTAVGHDLAAGVKKSGGEIQDVRWVRAENFHITLKFIGEVPTGTSEAIKNALRKVRLGQVVSVKFGALKFQGDTRRGGVLWCDIVPSENLPNLAKHIDRSLEAVGISADQRAYRPHLTIARVKNERAKQKLEMVAGGDFGDFPGTRNEFTTREFHLMQSVLQPTGAKYLKVESYGFATPLEAQL